MRVRIEYCGEWNYYPRAASLAADIKERFGVEAELKRSSGGVFEVKKDGDLIFSKRQLGRFPNENEVVELLAK